MKIREAMAERVRNLDFLDTTKIVISGIVLVTVGGIMYRVGVADGMKLGVAIMDRGFKEVNPIKWAELVTDTQEKLIAAQKVLR